MCPIFIILNRHKLHFNKKKLKTHLDIETHCNKSFLSLFPVSLLCCRLVTAGAAVLINTRVLNSPKRLFTDSRKAHRPEALGFSVQ